MLHIDRALAQAIVDRSMAIIDCNINVMDRNGIIVASGDRSRVGQLHEGALLVLAREEAVEIDGALARTLGAARPGVNLPLRAEGRVIGCVGLSGEPRDIRQHAELVRMAAETMLEQAQLLRLLAQDARLREELVLGLIRDDRPTPALTGWAERLGIDLATPRVVAVIELDSGSMAVDAVLAELRRLHALLAIPTRDKAGPAALIATVSLGELVVLMPALTGAGGWDPEAQRRRTAALLARIRDGGSLDVRIALGRYFPDAGGLPRSYQTARTTMAIGKRLHPDSRVHLYGDVMLPVLLDSLKQSWQAEELTAPLQPLVRHDRQGQLMRTLSSWFENGMQRPPTAKALNIHRNTLDYRMRRIEEVCGVDLGSTEDCVRLYLGLRMFPAAGM
ncbi:carbohydrate diacid regulator (plasmid) [Azospirillum sp. B510]|uniref:sugar diacid recognition domain-containing protein n=1 Tax=Azospirillum sp. (strain B510) TaxID=137722 RepID=UPI0001C4BB53|nr:sugar diacid recognition domain-containing protein [Azospirillum sp. B510]BAI74372.1 carbohydrate diacid regulator [Azospirillum sp. B510]